ncbi:hypothetical protein GGH94_001315 [Coemansia aciculifera]|uniref:Uncharacterized protein n=1 Tax=Coemansia aciculifera TaxID=417176 RepID=A0A9W8M7S2_9FUNG|nr:hypothetical protein GGH94_001315 [Coemansia aciculifera]
MNTDSHSAHAPTPNSNSDVALLNAQPAQENQLQEEYQTFVEMEEALKKACAHKELVEKQVYKKLQHAKQVKANAIAKAEEEYNAVMVEIHKSIEAKEATIAALEENAEKQHSNLRDRLTRVLSEDAVKKILAPTKPMAGQTRNEENDGMNNVID